MVGLLRTFLYAVIKVSNHFIFVCISCVFRLYHYSKDPQLLFECIMCRHQYLFNKMVS